ncbi:MAG: hypothetical protein UW22_C0073G0007 [Candidatus Gottesmanbacteria bacterium GW2011_GWB1_44_11c]|uniref:Uncharacterized protein n=1 Tax=Candidatus Gottesmanbacteria bacterium GW2011_GWB1_44_11c TaxID=1618447 RepID=A0A0G1IRS9_9BACT|nr:MAG: hypothetical protein UW22_C0073G0007 [Candidatus Gottesmanbacteria bacterium GW2011_GWB1_44_11c]
MTSMNISNFLTNTAIAYTLLLMLIILFAYVVLKTSDTPKKRKNR